MTNEPDLGTALTKCYFCLKDDAIILNSLLTRASADRVRNMHGKVVGMTPCPKCAELMKKGVILITIDSAKSEPDWDKAPIPNPYRTGGFFVVTDDCVRRVFTPASYADWAIEHRFMFIEDEAARAMGLFEAGKKPKASSGRKGACEPA